ncbi:MAG: isochorismatase family protein [Gammaproteobacteria bacterium]
MSQHLSGLCCSDNSQLLIIDVQKKLGQAMPTKVLNRVVLNTVLLASGASLLNIPILLTEQYPQGLGPTDDNVLAALKDFHRFEKTSFSATGAEGFLAALEKNNAKQIILVGMEAHVCILQTAMSLQDAGYHVFVVEDAICSRRLENYQNALDRLRQASIQVVSAESVTFEWLGDASHEHFKAIQNSLR